MTHFDQLNPADWSTVQPHIDALLDTDLTATPLLTWLQRWSDLEAHIQEYGFRAFRAMSEDTTDQHAEQRYLQFVEDVEPQAKAQFQRLKEKLLAADTSTLPPETSEMLRRFRAEADLFREENIPLLTENERLSAAYDKIIGAMTIELNGETLTMPQAGKYQLDPDRTVREQAWRAYHERFEQDREPLNELFLKMLAVRRQIARNADMDSPVAYIWQMYGRFDYTPADCRTFHDAIEHEIVPLMRDYHERRRQQLGVETLRPWDVEVDPQSRPALQPFTDVAELETGCQRIFDQLDPALGDYFRRMRDGYLDLDSRAGKAPGGYCGGNFVAKVPYIFMNAVGIHDDVQTLLHEGGHAFHFIESSQTNDLIWNYDGTIEFCEVASMGMELLAAPYLTKDKGGFYSPADAQRAHAEHLLSMITFLPYMAVVDAFQHWVYIDAPQDVSAADLDAKWSELWDRFMVGVDWSGLEQIKATGWQRKQHIFQAPLYYVEYGLAQLGALQIWRNAMQDQAQALSNYRAALALGNTRSLSKLFEAAGATFAFDRQVVGELGRLMDERLQQLV